MRCRPIWYEMMQVAEFCKEYSDLSYLSSNVILALIIREKNAEVREKAIVSISKAFKSKKDPITEEFRDFTKKKITAGEIRDLLKKLRNELRSPLNAPEENLEQYKNGKMYRIL